MSRKIETAILETLANHPGRRFSVSELAGIVYDLQPNPAGVVIVPEAQAGAVRNTLANLERRGRAFYVGRFYESPSARRGEPAARPCRCGPQRRRPEPMRRRPSDGTERSTSAKICGGCCPPAAGGFDSAPLSEPRHG